MDSLRHTNSTACIIENLMLLLVESAVHAAAVNGSCYRVTGLCYAVVCCFQNMSCWQSSLGIETSVISNVGGVHEHCNAIYKKRWSRLVLEPDCNRQGMPAL